MSQACLSNLNQVQFELEKLQGFASRWFSVQLHFTSDVSLLTQEELRFITFN